MSRVSSRRLRLHRVAIGLVADRNHSAMAAIPDDPRHPDDEREAEFFMYERLDDPGW